MVGNVSVHLQHRHHRSAPRAYARCNVSAAKRQESFLHRLAFCCLAENEGRGLLQLFAEQRGEMRLLHR